MSTPLITPRLSPIPEISTTKTSPLSKNSSSDNLQERSVSPSVPVNHTASQIALTVLKPADTHTPNRLPMTTVESHDQELYFQREITKSIAEMKMAIRTQWVSPIPPPFSSQKIAEIQTDHQ